MPAAGRLVLVVIALGAVCCGGGNSTTSPTSPIAPSLAGTWKATRAEFVNASNGSQRVEAVALGTAIVLKLESAGTFSQQTTEPGQPTETMTGTWSASSDVLTMKPSGVSFQIQFDMVMSGNTLTLNGGHVQFDVNNDNQDEEAILNMILARQ